MAYQVIEATCGVGRDRLERSWVPRRCPLRRNSIYVQWMKCYNWLVLYVYICSRNLSSELPREIVREADDENESGGRRMDFRYTCLTFKVRSLRWQFIRFVHRPTDRLFAHYEDDFDDPFLSSPSPLLLNQFIFSSPITIAQKKLKETRRSIP